MVKCRSDKEEHLTYVDNQTLHTQDVISLYEKTLFDIVTPSGHNLVTEKLLNLCYLVNHFYYGCIITLEDDFEDYGEYGHMVLQHNE